MAQGKVKFYVLFCHYIRIFDYIMEKVLFSSPLIAKKKVIIFVL